MIQVRKSSLIAVVLASMLLIAVAGAAWAGFTGPNRTISKMVRDPANDQWFCDKSGYSTCWFPPGNPCPDAGGSHPSRGAQRGCFGGSIADSCGCEEAYTESTTNLPPATVGGSESCAQPGNNGWCRGGAAIDIGAAEPLSGEVIRWIEGYTGVLCDPPDGSSISCSWSGGGEGNFMVEYWAVSSYGDTSEKASSAWKQDSQPPSASLSISGGQMGGGGWYRGGTITASVSGSDATSGVASALVSVNGGAYQPAASISTDGTHAIEGRVVDQAGNSAGDSVSIKYDGSAPSVGSSLSGSRGNAGWFISPVTAIASGSDSLSGIARLEVSVDGGGWGSSPAVISEDGTHSIRFRAVDVAGNEATGGDGTVRIDSTPPFSAFNDPEDGSQDWASGEILLAGVSGDATSGLAKVELSLDGGATWQGVQIAGGEWNLAWDTRTVQNGAYAVIARAEDVAGNVDASARLTLQIDNTPPVIDIPESWQLGEDAPVTITENGVGLDAVEIVISDGEIPILRIRYLEDEVPASIDWDGTLPDGREAPPGEYPVFAAAWDLLGNRGSDAGRILVPVPNPISIPGLFGEPEHSGSSGAEAVRARSVVETASVPSRHSQIRSGAMGPFGGIWIWPAIGWMGLLVALAFAKLSDPRAAALRSLRDDIEAIRNLNP